MQKSAENIDVIAEMKIDSGMLYFEYLVKNNGTAPLYLFNILHNMLGPNGVFLVDEGCYVELRQTEVVISKKQLSIPFGVLLHQKIVPFVTRISSQQSFRDKFQMPLPLYHKVYYERHEDHNGTPKTENTLPVSFELGYFFGRPGTDDLAKIYQTNMGEAIGFDPFPIGSQKIISIGPFENVSVYRS